MLYFKYFLIQAIFKKELYEGEELLKSHKLQDILQALGLSVNTKVLNTLVFTYAYNNALTLDDFIMCVIKAKILVERFTDDELKSKDRWMMRALA